MMSARTVETVVLDTFAVLAFLRAEAGGAEVKAWLERAAKGEAHLAMSTVNVGEVLYIVERRHGVQRAGEVLALLHEGPVVFYEATLPRVLAAAHLKARYPISYADAFAAALAEELHAPVLTADPEFKAVEGMLQVLWLSRR